MTKAPDRIFVSKIPYRASDPKFLGFAWNAIRGKDPQPYLLSTPAREAAEELLEALEHAVEQLKSYGADGYASGADAAIARAKGEG